MALSLCSSTSSPTTRSYDDDFLHIITFLARDTMELMPRANTCHAIFIFMFFYPLTMSNDMNISKVVDHIREDVCSDCGNKCELCKHGVCQDVVLEIGCFFIYCAEKEKE